MKTPHKHAEFIKIWVDSGNVQCIKNDAISLCVWGEIQNLSIFDNPTFDFRIKPERVWPKSSLNIHEILDIWNENRNINSKEGPFSEGYRAIADAAVKRHEEDKEK